MEQIILGSSCGRACFWKKQRIVVLYMHYPTSLSQPNEAGIFILCSRRKIYFPGVFKGNQISNKLSQGTCFCLVLIIIIT